MRSVHRWTMVAAVAGVLNVGVGVPAHAAVRAQARDTTTVTVTCGNGFIVLPPIVLAAPDSTTVIQCAEPRQGRPPASLSRRRQEVDR